MQPSPIVVKNTAIHLTNSCGVQGWEQAGGQLASGHCDFVKASKKSRVSLEAFMQYFSMHIDTKRSGAAFFCDSSTVSSSFANFAHLPVAIGHLPTTTL
jgi:hypothetical protein